MAGTVSVNIDLLPAFDKSTDALPIRVGRDRWIAHRGTVTPPDGDYVWPLADDYDVTTLPKQGAWTPEDYLKLNVAKLVEYTDGRLEFLPAATLLHQRLIKLLFLAMHGFVSQRDLGEVLFAPLRVYVDAERYREPDIVFMLRGNVRRRAEDPRYVDGADLVVEIVSEDDPGRDYHQKRQEYAAAGIHEYWIVDPQKMSIILLVLDGESYREVGTFTGDVSAGSLLLDGFSVKPVEVFAAAGA